MTPQHILLIDNFDSFTYNVVAALAKLGATVKVVRNDAITVHEALASKPDRIVISPGPCSPKEAGISVDLIRNAAPHIPILGICLGHQAIGAAFGGEIIRAKTLMHGKTSPVIHAGRSIFNGLATPVTCMRYHSLTINSVNFPDCLEITAWTADSEIMAVHHRRFPCVGVQFHPESIECDREANMTLLSNFLAL